MGLDYWLVHFTWTIPPAALLTIAYRPFVTRLEIQKISALIIIAVLATIPWDSFLIRSRIWTYPKDAVVGLTIIQIPVEEVFFFIIQTCCTGLLYVILTKHLVLPAYLLQTHSNSAKLFGSSILFAGLAIAATCIWIGGDLTYLGLILGWALPIISFQCFLCGNFLLALPKRPVVLSILIPTLYLWVVDFISLRRGTWVIEQDTKLDVRLWGYLDIEEAVFFLVSNVMVVFGLMSVDHGIAIAEYEIVSSDSTCKATPSLHRIAWSYIMGPRRSYDLGFLRGLSAAIDKLAQKSQSMYLGSAMFQDRLRVDLILLYSFCRVIDDLVDEAPDRETAQANIKEARQVLHWRFSTKRASKPLYDYIEAGKKESKDDASLPLVLSIALLPTSRLTITPLLELLSGFEMDLQFSEKEERFPIQTEADLELYAYRVAGTVASSLLELVFSHYGLDEAGFAPNRQEEIIQAGQTMGQALQYVNIARDIRQDATLGRVYIPTSWLQEEKMKTSDVLAGDDPRIAIFEERMLQKAKLAHDMSVRYIDMLPIEARGPVKTTVESYMMIGDMVRKRRRQGLHSMPGKLKVPLWRRVVRAWQEMQVTGE